MPSSDLLYEAVRFLAGVCDGARLHDGQGFNAFDTQFGHDLAARPWDRWTPKMKVAAWKMVRKYRGQLASMGIDYDQIPRPTLDEPEAVLTPEEVEDGWVDVEEP